MIRSKEDYVKYLKEDQIALFGKEKLGWNFWLKQKFTPHYIFKFQRQLRRLEYYHNCKSTWWGQLAYLIIKIRFRRFSLSLGFSIPINVFGPGLAIVHYGTIIVNPNTRIGKNCRIHADVNIGASGGSSKAPIIGDNVYIGPGVKIYGDIKLADNLALSANAVVNKSFDEKGFMLAGVPAKPKKEIDITTIIKHLAH